MRLYDWHLPPDKSSFSYGGDEVELFARDLETAFAPKQQPPQPHLKVPVTINDAPIAHVYSEYITCLV